MVRRSLVQEQPHCFMLEPFGKCPSVLCRVQRYQKVTAFFPGKSSPPLLNERSSRSFHARKLVRLKCPQGLFHRAIPSSNTAKALLDLPDRALSSLQTLQDGRF